MAADDTQDTFDPGDPRRLRIVFRHETVCPYCGAGEDSHRAYKTRDVEFAKVQYRRCSVCQKKFRLFIESVQ